MIDAETLHLAHRLADAAGAAIVSHFRKKIAITDKGEGKALFDPVTAADKNGEAAIRAILKAERPADGILGEEYGVEPGTSGRTWVLDPVDGTRAFITGQTQWGTLIALNEGGYPRLGILDQPVTRERFWGAGGEAFLDSASGREKLTVRACDSIADAVLMTTHPWDYFSDEEAGKFHALARSAKMSRFGGDCYAYGLLALGFVDCIVEARLKAWDIQALIPIVEGAGGIITDWAGGPCAEGGRVIACGDKRVHDAALKMLG